MEIEKEREMKNKVPRYPCVLLLLLLAVVLLMNTPVLSISEAHSRFEHTYEITLHTSYIPETEITYSPKDR